MPIIMNLQGCSAGAPQGRCQPEAPRPCKARPTLPTRAPWTAGLAASMLIACPQQSLATPDLAAQTTLIAPPIVHTSTTSLPAALPSAPSLTNAALAGVQQDSASSTAAPSNSYCDPNSIAQVVKKFQTDPLAGDGFGGSGSLPALLAYYKRLGCTPDQLNSAVTLVFGVGSALQGGVQQVSLSSDFEPIQPFELPVSASWYLAELGVAALAALLIRCWQDQPVGWLADQLVESKPSAVAGRGLFARVKIYKGTPIGCYPGRVRSPADMQSKVKDAPLAAQYAFLTSNNMYIDPTDSTGLPSAWPSPGLPWPLPVKTELAYANEPPKNAGGTNCFVEDGDGPYELLFVANRNIQQGEELFIDYGRTYDSSASKFYIMQLLAILCLSLIIRCAAYKRDIHHDEDMLPGWKGTDYDPGSAVKPDVIQERVKRMKVLDAEARIFLYENFLTPEEADHIIKISEPHMERSGVVDSKSGNGAVSNIRTSFGVFLNRGQDDVVKNVEQRIAAWTLLPVTNGEGLQVLRYRKDQKYEAHWDYFFHREGISNGGNRYATVLMYLADTEEGGETVFPNIPAPGGINAGFSECAKYHLAAKPRKGDAILFHSIKPSGELERKSLHTACPVLKGVKWSAAKWIHVGHYSMGEAPAELIEQHPQEVPKRDVPDGCEDLDDLCYEWAKSGECKRNESFMVGTRARPGKCVKACDRCDLVTTTGAEDEQNAHGTTSVSRKLIGN